MTEKQSDFLSALQQEAALQARLETHRLLPSELDLLTSFVGRYAWQVIVASSGMVALGIEIWRRM